MAKRRKMTAGQRILQGAREAAAIARGELKPARLDYFTGTPAVGRCKTARHGKIAPAHPGELLAEVMIPATGQSKAEIARRLGISRHTLYAFLKCRKPVTPALAARLGSLFGDGAKVWLHMQAAHDAWHSEHR